MGAEILRLVLMAPVVALRAALLAAWGCASGVALLVAQLNAGVKRGSNAAVVSTARVAASGVLSILGVRLVVHGEHHALEAREGRRPYFVCSNRLSYLDLLAQVAVHGPLGFCVPGFVLRAPIVGTLLRSWGCVEVGYEAERAALSRPGAAVCTFPPHLSFPEGRPSVGGCVLPFEGNGAIASGALALPSVLKYETANSMNLAWTAPHYTAWHMLQMAATWGKRVDVTVLPLQSDSSPGALRALTGAALGWPLWNGPGTTGKRPRGRPPKSASLSPPPPLESFASPEPKAAGPRPRAAAAKHQTAASPSPPPRGRGRPRKTVQQ